LQAPVGAGWDRVAIGTVEVDSELFLLVDPYCHRRPRGQCRLIS